MAGKVHAWGNNAFRQSGPQDVDPVSSPSTLSVPGNLNIVSVCSGDHSSFLISDEGSVYVFGRFLPGVTHLTPTRILELSDIVQISTGHHTLALTKTGHVWGWGSNDQGQLGLGHAEESINVPTKLPMALISQVFVLGKSSLFLTECGYLLACGQNENGQLGVGNFEFVASPTPVGWPSDCGYTPLTGVVSVACGKDHCLALTQYGTLYAWGNNEFYQLGCEYENLKPEVKESSTSDRARKQYHPVCVLLSRLDEGSSVVWIACGCYESMIMTTDGQLYTWGASKPYGCLNHNLGQGVKNLFAYSQPTKVEGYRFQLPRNFLFERWYCLYQCTLDETSILYGKVPKDILHPVAKFLLA
jgi:alpha-tubulin suppressor-like RCC1 family protein